MSTTPGKPRYSAIPTPGRTPGIPTPARLRSSSSSSQYATSSIDNDFASRAFVDAMKTHDPAQHRRTSDVSAASLSPQSAAFGGHPGRRSVTDRPSSAASSSSAVSSSSAQAQISRPRTPSSTARPRSRQSDLYGHNASGDRTGRHFNVGDNVRIESLGYEGTLKYVGEIDGKPGVWAGVQLSGGFAGKGKNDGAVSGKRYFTCPPQCGVFVALTKLSSPPVRSNVLSRPSSVASTRNGRTTPSTTGRITPSLSSAVSGGRITPSASTRSGRVTPSSNGAPGRTTPGIAKRNVFSRHRVSPTPVLIDPSITKEEGRIALTQSKITPGSRASRYIGMTAQQLSSRSAGSVSPTRNLTGASPTRSQGPSSPNQSSLTSPTRSTASPFATPKPKGRSSNVGIGIPSVGPNGTRTSLSTPRARVPSAIAMPPPASPSHKSDSSRSVSLNDNFSPPEAMPVGRQYSSDLEMNGKTLQDKISQLMLGRVTPQHGVVSRPESSASIESSQAAEHHALTERLQSRLEALEYENHNLTAAADQFKAVELQSSERIRTLEAERNQTLSRLSELEMQVKTSERSLDERDSKIESHERAVKQAGVELEKTRNDSDNRIKDLQSKLEDSETLVGDLKDAIRTKEGAQNQKDAILKAKDAEIALLEARVQKVYAELENERKELRGQIDELRQAGQETIALYEERLSAGDTKRYEMEDLITSLQERLRTLTNAPAVESRAGDSSTVTQIDNEALRDQVHYLQQKITSLEDALEDAHANSEREDVVVREKIRRYKEKEETTKKDLEESQTELEKAVQSESSAKARMQEIEEAFRESAVALENARAEIESLRTEITNFEGLAATMSNGDTSERFVEIAQRGASDRARLNNEISQLKEQLEETRRAIPTDVPHERSDSSNQSLTGLKEQVDNLELERLRVGGLLQASQRQLLDEQKIVAELRQALEECKADLDALRKKTNRDLSINNGLQEPAKFPSGPSPHSPSSKHDLAVARDEITGLKHILQEVRKENHTVAQQNKLLTSENQLLLSEIDKLRGELRVLEDNFEQSLLREEQALTSNGGITSNVDDALLHKIRQELKTRFEMELEQLRKRHAEAEMNSARTIHDLNKEVGELETLVESKIYHEDELERELERLREKVSRGQKKASKNSSADSNETRHDVASAQHSSLQTLGPSPSTQSDVLCEICERPGHDIFNCDLLSDDPLNGNSEKTMKPVRVTAGESAELFCEDCESHGHTAADCPHSLDVF